MTTCLQIIKDAENSRTRVLRISTLTCHSIVYLVQAALAPLPSKSWKAKLRKPKSHDLRGFQASNQYSDPYSHGALSSVGLAYMPSTRQPSTIGDVNVEPSGFESFEYDTAMVSPSVLAHVEGLDAFGASPLPISSQFVAAKQCPSLQQLSPSLYLSMLLSMQPNGLTRISCLPGSIV